MASTAKAPAPRAVGYVRVSTSEQAREGWSLSAQRRRIKAYCEAQGWKLVKVYADEGISGKDGTRRPEFERMVRDVLGDGITHIVALKLDRLGRSARQLLDLYGNLEHKGVGVVCIEDNIDTSTPQGRLFRTLLAAFAEFERDMISQRTRSGVESAKRNGKHVGRVPFGFRVEGGVKVKDDTEQAIVRRIKRAHKNGQSFAVIAQALNDEGKPSRAGRWHATTVARVVDPDRYKNKQRR